MALEAKPCASRQFRSHLLFQNPNGVADLFGVGLQTNLFVHEFGCEMWLVVFVRLRVLGHSAHQTSRVARRHARRQRLRYAHDEWLLQRLDHVVRISVNLT